MSQYSTQRGGGGRFTIGYDDHTHANKGGENKQNNGSPPSCKITTYLRHGISRISKSSFKNEQTMEADCKKQAKTVYTCK